jgi:hypothetical protein
MKKLSLAWGLGACMLAAPAFAHHSFAMFDNSKQVTLVGTIKEFQWTNPHAWIQINVPQPDGKIVEWSIECASPNSLKRSGWRAKTIKPGDKVTLVTNPLKNGDPGGSLVNVTLPDGQRLGRSEGPRQTGSAASGAPAENNAPKPAQ